MDTQEELKIGIGDEEIESLQPATVKIIETSVKEVGEKKNKKVVCSVIHPNRADPIDISAVKYEKNGNLEVVGLWLNKDSKELIRKGSSLACFMNFIGATTLNDLTGKDVNTVLNEKGYLCFKAY